MTNVGRRVMLGADVSSERHKMVFTRSSYAYYYEYFTSDIDGCRALRADCYQRLNR